MLEGDEDWTFDDARAPSAVVACLVLRIALVVQDFPPNVGGTHSFNLECANGLANRGHDVRVFTWTSQRGDEASADSTRPYPIHRVPYARDRNGLDPADLESILERWGSDVVLVSGSCRAMSRAARRSAKRAPVAIMVHDIRDKGRTRNAWGRQRTRRRYGYEAAARVVPTSEHNRGCALRLGVPPEKISVVHPGVDTEHFSPDPDAGSRLRSELSLEGHPILLTVGRLVGNKGHSRVIGILPRLGKRLPQLRYVIVGDGGNRDFLLRQARALGVEDLVHFAGRAPDTRPWYNACDVFVMASTPHARGLKAGEGFGIAYVEAAACGKPVVASSSGGGAEIVEDGRTGRVVDWADDDGLAAACEELLVDPARARELGQRARERAGRYDSRESAAALERVLEEVAASR